jgi:hypothetical protein
MEFTTIAEYVVHLGEDTGMGTALFEEIFAKWRVFKPKMLFEMFDVVKEEEIRSDKWFGDDMAKIAIISLVRKHLAEHARQGNFIQVYLFSDTVLTDVIRSLILFLRS